MFWVLIALISPLAHGLANILDEYLINRIFKNTWTLIFFSSLFNFLLIPLSFLIEKPTLPPLNLIPFLILIGLIEVLYLFPYYKALGDDDTSVVASLFALGDIFVPLLAFFIVGEILSFYQYLGFFIIILASFLLSFNGQKKFKFNKSLLYMLVCSLVLAVEVVLYKYVFERSGWSVGFIWPNIFSFLFALCLILSPAKRKDIKLQFPSFRKKIPVFALEEFLTFAGSMAATYAIFLVPVTLEKGISALQPVFVLLFAIILSRIFPNLFKEKIDRASIIKKIFLFIIMALGITLILK